MGRSTKDFKRNNYRKEASLCYFHFNRRNNFFRIKDVDNLLNDCEALMAVAVHSEELANRILSQGKNVMLCNNGEQTIYDISSMKKIHITDSNADSFFY